MPEKGHERHPLYPNLCLPTVASLQKSKTAGFLRQITQSPRSRFRKNGTRSSSMSEKCNNGSNELCNFAKFRHESALINPCIASGGRGDPETGRGAFAGSNQLAYEMFRSGGPRPA